MANEYTPRPWGSGFRLYNALEGSPAQTNPLLSLFANDPYGRATWASNQKNPIGSAASSYGTNFASLLDTMGFPTTMLGVGNLFELLSNKGKMDPALMNQQLAAIQRDTQSQQQAAQGRSQATGFQNAGVNSAIQAAIGQAGVGKQAEVRAQDAATAEQRRRDDLNLLINMLINPSIDYGAIAAGQYGANKAAQTQKSGATLGAIASIIGALFGG